MNTHEWGGRKVEPVQRLREACHSALQNVVDSKESGNRSAEMAGRGESVKGHELVGQ